MIKSKKKTSYLVLVAILLLLTVCLAVGLIVKPMDRDTPERTGGNTVSVNGNAQVTVKPDVAYITLGTLNNNVNAATARTANNAAMDKIMVAVKAQGVADKDIKTVNYSISPTYDISGIKITGYQIINNIQVKVNNLDKLGQIIQTATSAGANTADSLYFDLKDREGAYNQALTKAIENARQRAETLVKSANGTLCEVISVTETSNYDPTPIYQGNFNTAAGKGTPVSSGNMEINAAVSITYKFK